MLLLLLACTPPSPDDSGTPAGGAAPLTVVTFNTGTTEGLGHAGGDDGYTEAHAELSDQWYGDGLAWKPAVEAAAAFLAEVDPDVVGFQEIFWSGECADIPADAHADFVCEDWQPGDPTVAELILGPDYQVACHQDKPDKCVAVHRRVGTIAGCDGPLCLDGLAGGEVDGCGSGSRVGRAVVVDADGDEVLTVAHIHGSSGVTAEDRACRVAQVEQVFLDLGDGAPAASGARNLVLGDLNTDPGRWTDFDESAARWTDFVGPERAFGWVTEVGPDAPGSYQGVADIDHVASDALAGAGAGAGDCWIAGLDGTDPVVDAVYFDHRPVVCAVR